MPVSRSTEMSLNRDLRPILLKWAKKFVESEAAADRVVRRTINVICDNPELLDGAHMNEALFALLRRYAFDENDLRTSRQSESAKSAVIDMTDEEVQMEK
ncbi:MULTISPECIES: hypothetical protein [unclassified Rhizobium]|uniref:hypothetical protein n=1 Tax=unclassified Rhizobium TaxID=2613769 RepID=UPI000EA86D93|nr:MULTISPECIES: hypothetical protein [unclassified Rhizobium]AYG69337.1 hypothetical protein CCGE531_25245 [Rhizobium sp. CCGE531]AYG75716.1 hypothetical protein CCGE532_24750 [Rhizobium sp. CCGE532]